MIEMEFSDWFTKKYVEWRGPSVGNDRTISDFADWIEISQPLASQYMKKGGKVPKSQKVIQKIAAKYPEVYDVLGLERPDSIKVDHLPSDLRTRLESALSEINETIAARGIKPDSDEGVRTASQILARFGFKVTDIE